jgi:hypothetical protein
VELHKVKYVNNYALYANCNEECREHFWFCNAKFTVYSKEGEEEKKEIVATKPIYAFYGNNKLVIADAINLPTEIRQSSLIVEVDILRVQPKYVEIGKFLIFNWIILSLRLVVYLIRHKGWHLVQIRLNLFQNVPVYKSKIAQKKAHRTHKEKSDRGENILGLQVK